LELALIPAQGDVATANRSCPAIWLKIAETARLPILQWTRRTDSSRQEFLDLDGDLVSLNLNSLAIEVDIVAVVFGMASHRRVQIVDRNIPCGHNFRRNRVASRDPLVRVFCLRLTAG
jgi:hypothetical protein